MTEAKSYKLLLLSAFLIAGPLTVLFVFMGNAQEPAVYGSSVMSWLVHQWLDPRSETSHGFLIPLVSLYVIWQKRKSLALAVHKTDNVALFWIVSFLVVYWAGCRAQQPRGGAIAMIGLAWSVPYYLWGRDVARLLRFPCAYLTFAIPLGFLSTFTFPLRLVSCSAAVAVANGLGFNVGRIGTAIHSISGQFNPLDVADPCSGLNSIIALSALTAAYAYLTQQSLLGKWVMFLCSVPLAMIGNITRITTIIAVASVSGSESALKVYHDYSGYIVFVTAVVLMTATGSFLNKYIVPSKAKISSGQDSPPRQQVDQNKQIAVLCCLFCMTVIVVKLTGAVRVDDKLPVRLDLPERIGNFMGVVPLYCQNRDCGLPLSLDLAEKKLLRCPKCGGDAASISLAEKDCLPSDTIILKKTYHDEFTNHWMSVSVVISGSQRGSIHRPEWCLPSQGYNIQGSHNVSIIRTLGKPFEVALLNLDRSSTGTANKTAHFAYWFTSPGREVSSQLGRLLCMASDNIIYGVSRRWAYVAILMGQADAKDDPDFAERLNAFTSELRSSIIPQ